MHCQDEPVPPPIPYHLEGLPRWPRSPILHMLVPGGTTAVAAANPAARVAVVGLVAGGHRQVPLQRRRASIATTVGTGFSGSRIGAGQAPPTFTVPVSGQRMVEDGCLRVEVLIERGRRWGHVGLVHGVTPLVLALGAHCLAGYLLHSLGGPRAHRPGAVMGAQVSRGQRSAGLLKELPPLRERQKPGLLREP